MIRKPLLILAAVTALLPVSVPAYGNPPADGLHDLIAEHLDATGTPGAALAVTTAEATTRTDFWGVDGDGAPVTAATPFLWGSVAKPVTASVVLSLGVDPAAPVGDYLPGFAPTWRGEPAAPTVGQLLAHTSGITRMTATDVGDNAPGAVSRVAARLYDDELDTAPGTEYAYNSSNYLLLGAIAEAVTGREYADVAKELVLGPAGMTGAVTGAGDPVPPGHRQFFGWTAAFDDPYDLSGLPYGYLGGNIDDLVALGRFALAAGGTSPGGDMWAPQPGTGDRYGLGWHLGELPGTGEPMVWHPGATRGYQTVLILLPAKGIAVALAQNTYAETRAEQLLDAAFDAARISAGYRPGEASAPNIYFYLPWAAAGLALAALAAVLWRVTRGRRRWWRAGIWAAVAVAVPLVPGLAGQEWRLLWGWTPDLAWSLVALGALAGAAAVAEIAGRRREAVEV
ncbi:serine hydrolase domain-containing protein [Phytomonospora endophytica]|uniref:CubicO group peptidase (Beta-lactamase class C family) n=1 Tax=Phytomonospora endophytica TaxID=714109 RepID=A0A841FPH0_9ACTN|nr:serine hydrolase domain-containing protein [Phytomonospora endophytica]MBB6035452.1 CubicO group peptidase (beta-lactamase class C family) [Phytomonospora endophytica]GIG63795.1 hypothetical protein Pen01_00900 [Phytomonospora endophytica]